MKAPEYTETSVKVTPAVLEIQKLESRVHAYTCCTPGEKSRPNVKETNVNDESEWENKRRLCEDVLTRAWMS